MLFVIQIILLCFHATRVISTPIDDDSLKLAINATTSEAQLRLITEHILPNLAIDDQRRSSLMNNATPVDGFYTVIAEHFDQRATKVGYKRFLEALNEISIAKAEACHGLLDEDYESQLMQDFAYAYKNRSVMEYGSNLHSIRFLFGKLLCHNSTHGRQREVHRYTRSSCYDADVKYECPLWGIDGTDWSDTDLEFCHFWACLSDRLFKDILFPEIDGGARGASMYNPCLAFIIDTTGSMSDEIGTARKLILEFFRSEQEIGAEGCYMLVEFNDVDDSKDVPEESVGPVKYAYSRNSALELYEFYDSVKNIRAGYLGNISTSGGDRNEYALYAMQKALEAHDDIGFHMMSTPGSQMVVLTDAPSKQPELEHKFVNLAKRLGVCVHFFVNSLDHYDAELYNRIAEETHGTILKTFNHWNFTNFVTAYQGGSCKFLRDNSVEVQFYHRRNKRSLSQCGSFTVSKLSENLRLQMKSPNGSMATITRPNGIHDSERLISDTSGLGFFTETSPAYGSWGICSNTSETIVKVINSDQTDTTVLYGLITIPPHACTSEHVVIISSNYDIIQSAALKIIDKDGNVVRSTNLTKRDGALISNNAVTFPSGGYYFYQLDGIDNEGIRFKYDKKEIIEFTPPEMGAFLFNDIPSGELAVEMDIENSMTLEYDFINNWKYDTNFSFSGNVSNFFSSSIEPEHAVVVAGGSVKVHLVIRVIDESIQLGNSYAINITATTCNNQQIHAPTRTVRVIQIPETEPPPVDQCGGCLNGGTCVVYMRRGRQVARCRCLPGFIGRYCHVEI